MTEQLFDALGRPVGVRTGRTPREWGEAVAVAVIALPCLAAALAIALVLVGLGYRGAAALAGWD